ncbi:MAG: hypothetical protein IJY38_04635, partial [Clostridia bacterium]|nr:hypothetical protein [Clostridia bacterium]
MQIQTLSYELNNEKITLNDKVLGEIVTSVEVFSLENVYTVEKYEKKQGEYTADYLVWGDTERTEGSVNLSIADTAEGKRFLVKATLDKPVRSVKVRFDNLPLGTLINLTDRDREVTDYGMHLSYPEGWRSMSSPLLVFRLENGKYFYVRCLDKTVNKKIFVVIKQGAGMRLDVVQEQNGTLISPAYEVPAVEYGVTDDLTSIYQAQSDWMKETFGLEEYENISIAPSWLKDISLVVTMHMEAFTGHIFHTYEKALKDIQKLCTVIDGKKVLVYLPGWEGRYYYKYGNYTPDERLGGEKKLKEMVEGMQALGCKVMAMYGINYANKTLPGVREIYQQCEFQSVSGAKHHSGSVDWEGAHHYDFNELVDLTVANPVWGDYLFDQIKNATDKFGFDGAFLDIAACYVNDKNYSFYEGLLAFCDRLRTIKKDFLVAGEGYYDGMSKAMPLFQSGHTDGWLHYHDRASELLFTRFSREFAHLCIGDLSRGSTGTHEQGI